MEVPQSKASTIRSPSRSPPVQRRKEFPPRPIVKMTVPRPGQREYSQEQFQDQKSPETPKPRTNPPKPLSFEFRTKKHLSSNAIFFFIYGIVMIMHYYKYWRLPRLSGYCIKDAGTQYYSHIMTGTVMKSYMTLIFKKVWQISNSYSDISVWL